MLLFSAVGAVFGDSKRIVLVGDWNTILDPKIDKAGRGANGLDRCESSLVDFMARFDLVDRFRLDPPGSEMWTWVDISHSVCIRSYLDRVLVKQTDSDFVFYPTFHWIGVTDQKLVTVSLRFENRPTLAGYWKPNISYWRYGTSGIG